MTTLWTNPKQNRSAWQPSSSPVPPHSALSTGNLTLLVVDKGSPGALCAVTSPMQPLPRALLSHLAWIESQQIGLYGHVGRWAITLPHLSPEFCEGFAARWVRQW